MILKLIIDIEVNILKNKKTYLFFRTLIAFVNGEKKTLRANSRLILSHRQQEIHFSVFISVSYLYVCRPSLDSLVLLEFSSTPLASSLLHSGNGEGPRGASKFLLDL